MRWMESLGEWFADRPQENVEICDYAGALAETVALIEQAGGRVLMRNSSIRASSPRSHGQ